jgi:ABC-type hemin transport system substrate-binding protein
MESPMTTQAEPLAKIERDIAAVLKTQKATEKTVSALTQKLEAVSNDVNKTKDIVEAWNAVKTGGKFLKWLGGVIAAVTAIIVATKAGVSHFWGK